MSADPSSSTHRDNRRGGRIGRRGRAVRILLVDDHPLVREGVRSRLQGEARYLVVGEAGTAEEAMMMLIATQPQVVLLDVGPEGHNGIQLAQTMLERAPDLRVLMLQHVRQPRVRAARAAGRRAAAMCSRMRRRARSWPRSRRWRPAAPS